MCHPSLAESETVPLLHPNGSCAMWGGPILVIKITRLVLCNKCLRLFDSIALSLKQRTAKHSRRRGASRRGALASHPAATREKR